MLSVPGQKGQIRIQTTKKTTTDTFPLPVDIYRQAQSPPAAGTGEMALSGLRAISSLWLRYISLPFSLSFPSYSSSSYRRASRELQCEGYALTFFCMTAKNQTQTYMSSVTLGTDTQGQLQVPGLALCERTGLPCLLPHPCERNTRVWKWVHSG